ncbi:MAG: hypothetical protein U0R78_11185 [Nocardioidaceae bacterium]
MSRVAPGLVVADDLSQAWLETTKDVQEQGGKAFHTLTRIENPLAEDTAIREGYDALLRDLKMQTAETVAHTIFPSGPAAESDSPEALVARYVDAYPTLRRFGPNKKGTYFGRIVAYPSPTGELDQLTPLIRKLAQELETPGPMSARYEVGIEAARDRHSDDAADDGEHEGRLGGTEVAVPIFAPHKDTGRRAFPCLSLLSFQLDAGRVHLLAQYRYEYLVEKGYGNYLGLARLLEYVAGAVDLTPGLLTVTAGRIQTDASNRALASHLGDAWNHA